MPLVVWTTGFLLAGTGVLAPDTFAFVAAVVLDLLPEALALVASLAAEEKIPFRSPAKAEELPFCT